MEVQSGLILAKSEHPHKTCRPKIELWGTQTTLYLLCGEGKGQAQCAYKEPFWAPLEVVKKIAVKWWTTEIQ